MSFSLKTGWGKEQSGNITMSHVPLNPFSMMMALDFSPVGAKTTGDLNFYFNFLYDFESAPNHLVLMILVSIKVCYFRILYGKNVQLELVIHQGLT